MGKLALTWLGHGTFLLRSPGGRRILIDPWLRTNPRCPDTYRRPFPIDLLLITHGHSDHTADAVHVARATSAPVVSTVELCAWLEQQGVSATHPMNRGGSLSLAGITITMVPAVHSSSLVEADGVKYLGEPCGYVLTFEDGLVLYFAGDTAVFGDMRLIRDLYHPRIACLPIGDRYTMGPDGAALACELLGVEQVVPMHYGTSPELTGTPERLRTALGGRGVEVLLLEPGDTTG